MQHFEIVHDFPYPIELFERHVNAPLLIEMTANLPHLDSRKLLEQWTSEDGSQHGWKFEVWASSDVPRPARKLVGDKAGWVEETIFTPATHSMTFQTKPFLFADKVSCKGTYSMHRTGERSFRREIVGDIEVRIRIAGPIAEKFIVKNLQETYEAEFPIYLEFLKKMEEQGQ